MHRLIPLLLCTGTATLVGCNWSSLQRTGFETVESMRQQMCMDEIDSDCRGGRISYDEYQSAREQLQEQPN